MKRTKFMSILALGSMFLTTVIPTFAAGESTVGVPATYTTNSTSPDGADWLVTYPKKVLVTDGNNTPTSGSKVKFKVLDKVSLMEYRGRSTVEVTVPAYTADGISLNGTGGTAGDVAKLAIATSAKVEATDGTTAIMSLSNAKVEDSGYVYLKTRPTNATSSYSGTITFKFMGK